MDAHLHRIELPSQGLQAATHPLKKTEHGLARDIQRQCSARSIKNLCPERVLKFVQHFGGGRLRHSHDLGRCTQGPVFLNIEQ